jgi:prepilin-type processing-associated H-X9-DG protein
MVANLTFADGHCETKVVSGYGETSNASDPSLKAGDYLVWSGASDSAAPVKVSVTAVKHGATSSAKFGGALFGGGSGITVEKITTKIPN